MACLVFLLIAIGFSPIPAAAVGGSAPTGCTPGWQKVAQFDNSFLWTDGGVLPVDSAHWQGFVRLFEQVDADCYVVGVSLRYTGPLSGGSLILTGSPAVSFTVQHPSPFSQYANVGVNAYGELASWNPPAGGHITYSVSTNFGINPRGADEFVINGLGVPATVTNVRAFFTLPLDFVGKTIVAQIHVGPNKCLCKTTSIGVPGTTRPPADTTPPARVTDLAAASAGTDHVLLVWTAPGDDDMSGQASQYDIRYSTAGPLTDANFAQGTAFPAPAPASPGTSESLDVTGLAASTHYWFGLRTADEVPNWSPVSNSPDAVTSAPPPPPPPPQKTWAVYVHAHEDDWQLFMSPNTVADFQAGRTLLFIILTAGDGGSGSSIWGAREEAYIASIQNVVGTVSDTSQSTTICYTTGTSQVCHGIWERDYGTTVTFFMRLPDGNSDGGGFQSTGFQSLPKLRDGAIPSITAVDGSTTYTSWQDLYLTVEAVITNVAGSGQNTVVNAPDFDRTRQSFEGMTCGGCGDHPDHLAVADLTYTITIGRGASWSREWYIDYSICWADSRYPVNMDSAQYQVKKNLFMAYNDRLKALTGIDTYAQQPAFWENCFQREYYRVA